MVELEVLSFNAEPSQASIEYRCDDSGTGSYRASIALDDISTDGPISTIFSDWAPLDAVIQFRKTIEWLDGATVPISIVNLVFGDFLSPPLQRQLTAFEGVGDVSGLGLAAGNFISLAGENGYASVNALTGEVVTNLSAIGLNNGQDFGVLVLQNPERIEADALFTHGVGVRFRYFNPVLGFFDSTILGNALVFDAVHFGGDPQFPQALFVDGGSGNINWITFRNLAFGPDLHEVVSQPLIPGRAWANATGLPISAFAHKVGQPVLVATDGQPGQLYLADPAVFADPTAFDAEPTFIGNVGMEPRKVRCLNGVCVVSNFGSDSLTIVLWDGGDTATIVDEVLVGLGPVGIDLRMVQGNVSVISTALNDNTYNITDVAFDGTVIQMSVMPTRSAAPMRATVCG